MQQGGLIMADDARKDSVVSDEIKETDIVFDCTNCGKSLAIDYRGAGLTIPCTDCGEVVQVPIPEGMELADIDSSAEEQEIRIMHLRKALASAEAKIEELQSSLEDMTARKIDLEELRDKHELQLISVRKQVSVIDDSLRQIKSTL
jgi:transcription elongation factor Elf1